MHLTHLLCLRPFLLCCVIVSWYSLIPFFFFFPVTATTEIYTLSLHDALPIFRGGGAVAQAHRHDGVRAHAPRASRHPEDRKSTRLNSSHRCISYAVFCLKKKKRGRISTRPEQENLELCIWHIGRPNKRRQQQL